MLELAYLFDVYCFPLISIDFFVTTKYYGGEPIPPNTFAI